MFKQGDRVVLQSDFKYYKLEVKSGTVGTITMMLDEDKAIIRYGYDHFSNRQLIVGIPTNMIRLATMDELTSAVHESLVLPMYQLGQKIVMGLGVSIDDIKTNDVGVITKYTWALNEQDDTFRVEFSNNSVARDLKMSFIETYCRPYDEEIENQMGDQIDFNKIKKNYHIIGARMFLMSKSPENVVILIDQKEDDKFEVMNINGDIEKVSKGLLIPIIGHDLELFNSYGNSNFIRSEFSVGKRFRAKEEIAKHVLLNGEFKPGDVVEVIHVNEIFINSFNDTVVITRTGGNAVIVSVLELANYFEPFKGMIKKSAGQVVSNSNVLEEIEKEMINDQPKEEKVVLMMPEVEDTHQDLIQINDITINGFRFTIEHGVIQLNYDDVTVDTLDDYIKSLTVLKGYVKGR